MGEEELQRRFVGAMRRLAATVSVVTCRDLEGNRYGMAATAVTSLSLEPVSLLICVNRASDFYQRLSEANAFCVNMLSESQADQTRLFGSGHYREQRFTTGTWSEDPGAPPTLAGAQANLICTRDASFNYGSHAIVVGRVNAVLLGEAVAPLIYLDRQVVGARSLGFDPAPPISDFLEVGFGLTLLSLGEGDTPAAGSASQPNAV